MYIIQLIIFIGLWKEANDHLNEAKNIFEVMFGDNHPIVTEKCHNIQIQIVFQQNLRMLKLNPLYGDQILSSRASSGVWVLSAGTDEMLLTPK